MIWSLPQIFLSLLLEGQPGPDGTRADGGAHPRRTRRSSAPGPGRGAQTAHDRGCSGVCQALAGQRDAAAGRGAAAARRAVDALSLAARLGTSFRRLGGWGGLAMGARESLDGCLWDAAYGGVGATGLHPLGHCWTYG